MFGLALDIVLLTGSAYWLTSWCRFTRWPDFILSMMILGYAQIVLSLEILSELHQLTATGLLIIHVIFFWGAWLLWRMSHRPRASLNPLPGGKDLLSALREHKALSFLAGAVLLLVLLGAWLIMVTPPNEGDTLLYYLPRVAHWRQNSTLKHISPLSAPQLELPINAELGMLWTVLFTHSDYLVAFISWIAYLGGMLVVYNLTLTSGFSRPQATFTAFSYATFPVVIYQSTSTKNDILLAFFVGAGFYFLLLGLQERRQAPLIFSGMALGIAAGIKAATALVLPAMTLTAFFISGSKGESKKRILPVFWLGACALSFVFLGAYNYILNWARCGDPLGVGWMRGFLTISNPNLKSLWANLGRICYIFVDFSSLPNFLSWPLNTFKAKLAEPIFSLLRMPVFEKASTSREPFSFYRQINHGAGFGLMGFLLLCSILWHIISLPYKNEKGRIHWFIALVSLSYFAAGCLVFKWNWVMTRYFIISMVCGMPLLAFFYPAKKRKISFRAGIIPFILVMVSFYVFIKNSDKPLVSSTSIWTMDSVALRCKNNPQLEPVVRYVEKYLPVGARIGILGIGKEYPLFGRHFERYIIPFPSGKVIDKQALTKQGLDFLIINKSVLSIQPEILLPQKEVAPGIYLISLS